MVKEYYSAKEIMYMLSISKSTAYRILNDPSVKTVRIRGLVRISRMELARYLKEHEVYGDACILPLPPCELPKRAA